MHINEEKNEKVLLVGIDLNRKNDIDINSSMEELKELVIAAGGDILSSLIQKKEKIDSTYYIGKGKVEEIKNYCDELDVDTVVFNDELTGAQLRNLENAIGRKIIDRTNLILDIFAKRAVTKEGKLQVELAQLRYRLPRLIGLGNKLSRTGAGIGTRGPGEKKLEIDRRHILSRINEIKRQLNSLENVRIIKRKKRQINDLPIVALVGYTNAGKSTLFNRLIKESNDFTIDKTVLAKDMLFATLDITLRKSTLPNGHNFLVTDTVGFVSKLPTHLVEAFKGTLEEVKFADLLLHVVDITNKDLDIQIKTTMKILEELNVQNKPIITVFNKIDKCNDNEIDYLIEGTKVFISAEKNINIDKLLKEIETNLPQKFYKVNLVIPYDEGSITDYIFRNTKIIESSYKENGINITTVLDEKDYNKYKKYIM